MSVLSAKKPKDLLVKDLMTTKVISVKAELSVPEVAHILTTTDISSAPVLDEKHHIIGFVTLGDCLKCMVNCVYNDQLLQKTASDIMTKSVQSISEESDIFELENFFLNQKIHQAPVVSGKGELLGMISRADAVSGIQMIHSEMVEYKEAIKEPLELDLSQRMQYLAKGL